MFLAEWNIPGRSAVEKQNSTLACDSLGSDPLVEYVYDFVRPTPQARKTQGLKRGINNVLVTHRSIYGAQSSCYHDLRKPGRAESSALLC